MIKALFFDIDGTLVSFKTHQIPQSTITALEKIHRKGLKIIIATGRPLSIINNLDAINPLIDGYVCTNGSHCFVGKHTVYIKPHEEATVQNILGQCKINNLATIVVGVDNIALFNFSDEAQGVFLDKINIDCRALAHPLEEIRQKPILQLTPFYPEAREKELFPNLEHCIFTRWHSAFADITPDGVDKGQGLSKMAEYFGFSIAETMGFGDGGNDIPLIQAAGVGVAMGNAKDAIKKHADFVTTSVDEDGISSALKHFGIL